MAYQHFSDADVINLVRAFKEFLQAPIQLPALIGRTKDDTFVEDSVNHIHYVLHYFRGNLENKYSIHLRFSSDHTHLVRLCVNGSRHYNSDGTFEEGNHLHLYHYVEALDLIEARVYPLNDLDFANPEQLIIDLEKFIAYVNIQTAQSDDRSE